MRKLHICPPLGKWQHTHPTEYGNGFRLSSEQGLMACARGILRDWRISQKNKLAQQLRTANSNLGIDGAASFSQQFFSPLVTMFWI